MNHYGRVVIGFGNRFGETSQPIISEQKSRIQIGNLRATMGSQPKISVKKISGIQLGPLKTLIAKKRNQQILSQLLKVNIDVDTDDIQKQCQQTQMKIQSDLALVKALIEDSKLDKFLQKAPGSNIAQAKKYLQKYPNFDKAVQTYKQHQKKIDNFMKQQNCSKEMAKQFLQANDYNVFE